MSEQSAVAAAPRTRRRLVQAAIAGGIIIVLAGVAVLAGHYLSHGHAKFPLEAARLPTTTTQLDEQELKGAHEKSEKFGRPSSRGVSARPVQPERRHPVTDPAERRLRPGKAIAYFSPGHMEEVRSVMSCGREWLRRSRAPTSPR